MKKRRICVLGGTGFVGSHLVARLARDGHYVRVLTRRRERHRSLLVLPTVDLVQADLHESATLQRQLAGCDTVINLVGILNEGRKRGSFHAVHVELVERLLAACRRTGVIRILHMSALGADATGGTSRYLRSKGEGEDLVHRGTAQGLQVTSFRPSVIFGADDHFFNRFAALLKRIKPIFPLACPDARFAPVFVGDVVEAFVSTLDNPHSHDQRYELCGPRVYTLQELVTYTAHVLGLKRYIIRLSDGMARFQAYLMEYLPGKPFSRDNYLSLKTDSVCTQAMSETLGLKPTAVEALVPGFLRQRDFQAAISELRRTERRN